MNENARARNLFKELHNRGNAATTKNSIRSKQKRVPPLKRLIRKAKANIEKATN